MKKIVAGFLTASMLFAVTACGNSSAQSIDVGSGETRTENNEELSAGSDLSESEATTAAPVSGAYTYTVYGNIQLSMDVNVDDYIFTNENNGCTFFKIAQLAYDCGWLGNDQYSSIDNNNSDSYIPDYYSFHNGDMVTEIRIGCFSDEPVPNTDNSQFNFISMLYSNSEGEDYYSLDDLNSNPLHRELECQFEKHYDSCDYRLVGEGWYLSYDDIVILSYIFWAESENPGVNPLVAAIGLDSEYSSDYTSRVQFNLP